MRKTNNKALNRGGPVQINTDFLKNVLGERKIRLCQLAKAADLMSPSKLSTLLNGWEKLSERNAIRLIEALTKLGVEMEVIKKSFID